VLGSVQEQVAVFLADLERLYRGVGDAAVTNGGQFVAHLEHWPSNPLAQGAYTCYLPVQFTSVAGLESRLECLHVRRAACRCAVTAY
jgi:monoamine oxidase